MSALDGSQVIGYRRLASPLHAARAPVAAGYGAALAAGALIVTSPVLLLALLLAVLLAAACAGVIPAIARAARRALLPVFVLSVLVNVLVSRGGLTVFARLGDWGVLGQVNLTVEAVIYGLVFGLRLLVASLACLLVACAANPDELLLAVRRISPRSALTATLTTRLIPVLAQDAGRLADAQRCRPGGSARGARGRLSILSATVGGALDRSLDVAAVLEMRGYGAAGRTVAVRPPPSRHDIAFALSAVALLALAIAAQLAGAAPFSAYPLASVGLGLPAFACGALLVALAALPFADRRGIEP